MPKRNIVEQLKPTREFGRGTTSLLTAIVSPFALPLFSTSNGATGAAPAASNVGGKMTGARSSGDPGSATGNMEGLSIPELLTYMLSSFRPADFGRVEKILVEREASAVAAARSDFSEALTLREIEKIELETKCESLRKEVECVRGQSVQLEERAKLAEEGFRVFAARQEREARDANVALEARVRDLALEKSVASGEAEKYRNLCGKLEGEVLEKEEEVKVVSLREREAVSRIEEMKKREQEFREKILELQVENGNLACALRTAEVEVMDWKRKYGEVEALSLRLVEENMSLKAKGQGMTPKIDREDGSNLPTGQNRDEVRENSKPPQVLKLEGENSDREVYGAVRGGAAPAMAAVIEIIESEDEMDGNDRGCLKQNMAGTLGDNGDLQTKSVSNELRLDLENDAATLADGSRSRENVLSTSTPKRKRTSRVIMSDSESEEDENRGPKEESKRSRVEETVECSSVNSHSDDDCGNRELVTPLRRRLVPLSQCSGGKDKREIISSRGSATAVLSSIRRDRAAGKNRGSVCRQLQYPVIDDVRDDEVHGDEDAVSMESDSEGESLGGFIVDESSASNDECSSASVSSEQEESSDASIDMLLSKICREKHGMKWEYEADMLASFGKDPLICMKAVCALYRQQTADEQSVKGTLLVNNRGFNKLDARRWWDVRDWVSHGTDLNNYVEAVAGKKYEDILEDQLGSVGSSMAEFLTDGNPEGPLTKSVKDLERYDATGVEYCNKLATRYSKQLFMIYKNGEDPYFLPT
ncbi:hypothetical protein Taro_008251 [Colocasia esculenta]|uniref:Uncharacterized protein n=1 Tax=Colocasia esculenta TaxID=4460 RepID=A0A843U1V3_COLES|nr:hypothetical protein [Colocasia esculenta]